MKATLETFEPVIRPMTPKSVTTPVRSPVRTFAVRAIETPALFHAWRA